jgi:hypothetical protein
MVTTHVLLAIALCGAPAGAAAETHEATILETPGLRLEIGRDPAPYVSRLVHKKSGQAVVADPAAKNLFAVVLDREDGRPATVESSRAGQSSASMEKTGDGQKLVLRYAKFPEADVSVEVAAAVSEKDPLVRWSMRVENPAGRRLRTIRFPMLVAVPTIGDGKDDFLVLPALPGTLIENPAANWRRGQSVVLSYPGNLSAQFLTYQDRTAGVYLAGMDSQGYPMALAVSMQAEGFALRHEFTPVADEHNTADGIPFRGKKWESPYPVALGVVQGDWYDSADVYKRWAVGQPWCARPLAQREDVPSWWKQGPAVHVLEVRTYDSQRTANGSYYPRLLDHLRALREKIDGPIVAMLAGWENHRRWTAGDYFPAFDEENARKVIPQLKEAGFRPFFFLSGLFYTYENEGRDGSAIPAAERYAASYVIDEATGKPRQFRLDESSPAGGWKRHSYEFCAAPPATTEFFRGVVDRAHALGVDVLQMDQTVSGAGNACYSTQHGHAPGEGLYRSRQFWKLLDDLRRHGKTLSPDFILLHEEPHEQLIPYLDGFHVREYYEKRWYRDYPGARGIPLFSYLYHEYALGYGGDSAGLSPSDNRWLVRSHAMNLVAGRTPGAAVWSSPKSALDAHPDQLAILRNHGRLLKTRAGRLLMLGRMLHPLALDVPMLELTPPGDRRGRPSEKFPTPSVLTSSWQSPEGSIGHLLVNIAQTGQPLRIQLDTRNVPASGPYDAEIWRSTCTTGFEPLWQRAGLPRPLSVELKPAEVVFVELRGVARPK